MPFSEGCKGCWWEKKEVDVAIGGDGSVAPTNPPVCMGCSRATVTVDKYVPAKT